MLSEDAVPGDEDDDFLPDVDVSPTPVVTSTPLEGTPDLNGSLSKEGAEALMQDELSTAAVEPVQSSGGFLGQYKKPRQFEDLPPSQQPSLIHSSFSSVVFNLDPPSYQATAGSLGSLPTPARQEFFPSLLLNLYGWNLSQCCLSSFSGERDAVKAALHAAKSAVSSYVRPCQLLPLTTPPRGALDGPAVQGKQPPPAHANEPLPKQDSAGVLDLSNK